MDADIFVSGKKKLRIQKYPDTCGPGLNRPYEIMGHHLMNDNWNIFAITIILLLLLGLLEDFDKPNRHLLVSKVYIYKTGNP